MGVKHAKNEWYHGVALTGAGVVRFFAVRQSVVEASHPVMDVGVVDETGGLIWSRHYRNQGEENCSISLGIAAVVVMRCADYHNTQQRNGPCMRA